MYFDKSPRAAYPQEHLENTAKGCKLHEGRDGAYPLHICIQ